MYQICKYTRTPHGKQLVLWLHEHKGARLWARVRSGAVQFSPNEAHTTVLALLDTNLYNDSYAAVLVGSRRASAPQG